MSEEKRAHELAALLDEVLDDLEHVVDGNPDWIDRDMLAGYSERLRATEAVAAHAAGTAAEDDGAAEITRLRGVLERLADLDVWVLDSGLGGGYEEDRHVRASLAAQALGLDVCPCSECCVSLGIAPEDRP